MRTGHMLNRFEREYQQYNGISPGRAHEQLTLLRQFADTLDGRTLDQATASDLMAFAGALAQEFHVNTVRKKLGMIRSFLTWGWSTGLYDADTYLRLKAVPNPRGSTSRTQPNPYTRAEIQEFWTTIDQRMPWIPESGRGSRALTNWVDGKGRWVHPLRLHATRLQVECAVRLALDLGMRRSEIFNLSLDDLHYDNAYIVVHGKADPGTGDPKIRRVPITEHAREAIKAWVEFRALLKPGHDRPWLFLYRTEIALDPISARRFSTLLQTRVGEKWAWHRFRHTCATERLRSGMTLEGVQKLLGHATLQQTLAYAEIGDADIHKQMEDQADAFQAAVGRRAA